MHSHTLLQITDSMVHLYMYGMEELSSKSKRKEKKSYLTSHMPG